MKWCSQRKTLNIFRDFSDVEKCTIYINCASHLNEFTKPEKLEYATEYCKAIRGE